MLLEMVSLPFKSTKRSNKWNSLEATASLYYNYPRSRLSKSFNYDYDDCIIASVKVINGSNYPLYNGSCCKRIGYIYY